MNRLRALFERNKKTAAVLGAVAVGGLALVARRRAAMGTSGWSTTSSSSAGFAAPSATTSTYSASGQPAVYDSTGTDVYNALQPQIEALQQLAKQIPVAGSTPATDTPTVDTTPQGYYRRTGTQAVYRANADGTLTWLDRAAYDGAGDPAYKDVAATDPVWNRKVAGTDAPAQFR